MRRPSIYTQRGRNLDIQMTPMIDVVFLLLVFFLWTASFHIVENVLPSNLSAAGGSQPADPNEPPPPEADFDDVIVHILYENNEVSWRINGNAVATLPAVRKQCEAIYSINAEAPVILHPDPDVPLGSVIEVLDLARRVGFEEVRFATSQQDQALSQHPQRGGAATKRGRESFSANVVSIGKIVLRKRLPTPLRQNNIKLRHD